MASYARKSSRRKPKVSIVVPIYNVEKYLRECVDSILKQSLRDIEVILVDDGSPDGCGKIIDKYARTDTRVVAVHQENSGYSKAVNRGIEMARGEYIGIIESDDWIEDDMYESLYKNARKNKTEVTKGMFYIYRSIPKAGGAQNIVYRNPNGIDLRFAPDGVFAPKDWPRIIGFHASIWSAIYKADFIKKIKIPETAGASYQDFPFMAEVFCRAKRISVVKRPFVHWRNDDNQGNSTSARGEKLLLMAENSKTAISILKKYKKFEIFKEPFFVHVLWTNYEFFNRISWKFKKKYYDELVEIFAEIKDDSEFHFAYFSTYENNSVRYFLEKNGYRKYIFKKFLHEFKQFLIKIATTILPSYKMTRFLKDQNFDIMHQNELLMDEILALRREIEKLKK
ncbi:glycosyltransferase [Candidatus Saccharibacteria bacterium]|nr:glycosyltransferase [Candidatus Saccharibacteria bacterium]